MPGCVDEIQMVDNAILRFVIQRHRLRLDGDTALLLDIHRVENLCGHLSSCQSSADLDEPVGNGGFTMIDVGNNGKVTYILLHAVGFGGTAPTKDITALTVIPYCTLQAPLSRLPSPKSDHTVLFRHAAARFGRPADSITGL